MSVDWFWPRLRIFARWFQGWSWNGRSYIHEWSKRKIGIAILIPGDIPSHLTSPNIRIINASWWVSFDNEQLSSNNGTYACTHFRFPLIWPWCHNATLEPHFPPFNNSAAYSCVFRRPKCPPLFSVLYFMLLFHPSTFASRAEQRFARRLISCTIKASAVLPSTISQIQEDDRTSPYLLRTLVSGWQRKDHCASPLLVTQPQSFAFGCSHAIRANQDAGSFGPGRLPRYLPIEDRTLCTLVPGPLPSVCEPDQRPWAVSASLPLWSKSLAPEWLSSGLNIQWMIVIWAPELPHSDFSFDGRVSPTEQPLNKRSVVTVNLSVIAGDSGSVLPFVAHSYQPHNPLETRFFRGHGLVNSTLYREL